MSWQQEQESSPLFNPLRTFGAQGSHSQEVPEICGGVRGALLGGGGWGAGDQNLMRFSHQVMAAAVAAAGKAQLWWENQTFHLLRQYLSRVITYAASLPATIPVCARSPSHFFKIFFFFDVDHFLNFDWICYNIASGSFWFFGYETCGILDPRPGIEPAPPALEGKVLTTGPPEKSSFSLLIPPLSLVKFS